MTKRRRAHEEEPIETPPPAEETDDPITPVKRAKAGALKVRIEPGENRLASGTTGGAVRVEGPSYKDESSGEFSQVRQPDFMWSGLPVYRCRFCGDQYERVGNPEAVTEHEKTQHPTNARVTGVLGPDGRPLIVVS